MLFKKNGYNGDGRSKLAKNLMVGECQCKNPTLQVVSSYPFQLGVCPQCGAEVPLKTPGEFLRWISEKFFAEHKEVNQTLKYPLFSFYIHTYVS